MCALMFVHNSTLSRFWVRYSVHDQCFSLYFLPNIQFHINCNSLSLMRRRVRIGLQYPFFLLSLFVRVFSSHSRILYSFADVTYARNSWPLSSVGFLTCHTYCDMLYIGHLRGPCCRAFGSGVVITFKRLWSSTTGDRTPISRMRKLYLYTTSAVVFLLLLFYFF